MRERFDNYSIPDKVRACPAQMAELVDALGSGPSGGNTVEVRVLFWAPRFFISRLFPFSNQAVMRPLGSPHADDCALRSTTNAEYDRIWLVIL